MTRPEKNTNQYKTIQENKGHEKPTQDTIIQYKTSHDNVRQYEAIQHKTN